MITKQDGQEFCQEFNAIARRFGVRVELVGSLATKGQSDHDIDVKLIVFDDALYELFGESFIVETSIADWVIHQLQGRFRYENPGYECFWWKGITVDVFYEDAETPT